MTRWQEIAGKRGGTFWSHVAQHGWAVLFFALGLLTGWAAK